jgi:aquaporin Z
MNKYIVEFIGTFFLVLTAGCSVLQGNAMAPLAIGAVLMAMIFAGGHISGAHFNPAVTLGVALRGKCTPQDAVAYMIFQIAGAIVAVFTAKYISADALAPAGPEKVFLAGPAFVAELLFTFALVWVVLNAATSKGTANNSFYGLAIGFTVLAGAFSVGHISGGAFNPAVAIAATLVGFKPFAWNTVWVHLIADFLGGALAAVAFKSLSTEDAAS